MSDSVPNLNPYQPPSTTDVAPSLPSDGFYFREDKFLVVRDGAELPAVCMLTNEPEKVGDWRKRVVVAWCPPWVYLLILVNLIVMVIVALVIQKKARVSYTLSAESRQKIIRKRAMGFFFLVATVGLGVLAANGDSSWAGAAGLCAFLSLIFSLICFVVANPIKAIRYRDGWFQIKGCSREFLDTLPVGTMPIKAKR